MYGCGIQLSSSCMSTKYERTCSGLLSRSQEAIRLAYVYYHSQDTKSRSERNVSRAEQLCGSKDLWLSLLYHPKGKKEYSKVDPTCIDKTQHAMQFDMPLISYLRYLTLS